MLLKLYPATLMILALEHINSFDHHSHILQIFFTFMHSNQATANFKFHFSVACYVLKFHLAACLLDALGTAVK